MAEPIEIAFTLNAAPVSLQVGLGDRLLDVLRDRLWLTGAKEGCGKGECGACSVLVNGQSVDSCLMMAYQVDGAAVETVEGLARGDALHPIQRALVATGGSQCGACIPGIVMAGKALLDRTPQPSPDQVRRGLSGNLCRCTGYTKIFEAITDASKSPPAPGPEASPPPPLGRAPARVRPRSLSEALELLQAEPQKTPLAGGTDILIRALDGELERTNLVDLTAIPELQGIEQRTDTLWIGATTSHAAIAASPLVAQVLPPLAEACALIGAPQVRNRGSLGGNLANASPAADTVPPLYVAEAVVELASAVSRRTVPIAEFFTGPGGTVLEPGELIVGVRIPSREGLRGGFRRLGQRRAQAISKVSVAVALSGELERPDWVRVAFGAVAPTVIRAEAVEAELTAEGEDRLERALEAARREVRPIDDIRSTREYRREMAAVLLGRVLRQLAAQPGSST